MASQFDRIIDRRNTNSLKWDFRGEHGMGEDVLPLWLADMDFKAPAAVADAVRMTADHGIFGYTDWREDFFLAAQSWYALRHGYVPAMEWMTLTPGIVFAVAAAIRAFTEKGDGVLIQPPVYKPFTVMTKSNERRLVENPLRYVNGRYEIDFLDLEVKLRDPSVKLMILCSPHNPVGRIWSAEDLRRVGELCEQNGVLIVSDEIHCDFAFEGKKHHIFATLGNSCMDNSIVCLAPSKTFNIAGLQLSAIFIANEAHRRRFRDAVNRTGAGSPNTCGLAAAKAAYTDGAPWLDELILYLQGNERYVRGFLMENLPMVRPVEQDGTFLMWLDFSALNISHEELNALLIGKAKLWLDDGRKYGHGGELFQRLNIGCPRATLEDAMARLAGALNG